MSENQAAAPVTEPGRSSQPREYIVFREMTVEELQEWSADGQEKVLVELGKVEAKTAKEARRTIAKQKLDEAELKTEEGVPLRAITKTSATAGRGVAKLRVEPVWED